MVDAAIYESQLIDIVRTGQVTLSNIKPSDWVEQNIVMGDPFPGPFRYSKTPYAREIIDCLAPDHPARWIAVMKGLQVGISSGVVIPGMGWIIKNSPANTYFTVGAPDLINKSVEKLDLMIDRAGLKDYIKPQVQRKRNNKTGDTNTKKDFSGGFVNITTPNNHKEWRDVSLKYGFIDDFEAAKSASKESGSTRKLIEGRFAAYKDSHKIFYISTPELKSTSNIEPAYLLGDQRKYMIPCPCCHEFIEIKWNIESGGGMVWETDNHDKLIESSVGYVCQKCAGFFKDNKKDELLRAGHWQPTAEPKRMGFYSYHISSLYAPSGMYDWKHYVNNYLECNPPSGRIEDEYKTFVTSCLGETYEPSTESPKATSIIKNKRPYEVGDIPEKLSMADGNGRIVLITCAADMNGKVDDARLDYEIVAWAASGANYSIAHGSIGTFVPRESTMKVIKDREHWTYEFNKHNSVWPEFDKIIDKIYTTDTGRQMQIMYAGLDCGYYSSNYAYPYIDGRKRVVGLKGKGEEEYIKYSADVKYFMEAKERKNLFIVTVGKIKDDIADQMQLTWRDNEPQQPFGFMNFPMPSNGLYDYENYFEHYEAEHCIVVANPDGTGAAFRWEKKRSNVMNHMFDCRVYNIAVRDIILHFFAKEQKLPKMTWREFADQMSYWIEQSLKNSK